MKSPFIKPLILTICWFTACLLNISAWADLAPAIEAPRVCEITSKGNTLTIVAGPDLSTSGTTDLAAEFPVNIPCPPGSAVTGLCSQWNYRYDWKKQNPSLTYVDVSSDLTLVSIDNAGNFSAAGAGEPQSGSGENNYDVRWIKWSKNETTFDASFITSMAKPRIASAGGKSGNFEGFCAILGAGIATQQKSRSQDVLVSRKVVTASNGSEICTKVNPFTQCEYVIDCETDEPLPDSASIPIEEVLDANKLSVIEVSVPGQACPTFVTNDGLPDTYYYCSGGDCWVWY